MLQYNKSSGNIQKDSAKSSAIEISIKIAAEQSQSAQQQYRSAGTNEKCLTAQCITNQAVDVENILEKLKHIFKEMYPDDILDWKVKKMQSMKNADTIENDKNVQLQISNTSNPTEFTDNLPSNAQSLETNQQKPTQQHKESSSNRLHGANPNIVLSQQTSQLFLQEQENNSNVRTSFSNQPSKELIMKQSTKKLLTLVSLGQIDAVKEFVTPENVNLSDGFGNCAVLIAAQNNNLNMLKLLTAAGAKLDVSDSDGRTPLGWATHNKNNDMINFINTHISSTTIQPEI